MHPNPAFRKTSDRRNIDYVRERGFGTFAINHPDGPLTANIPALLSEVGETLDFHLLNSNPIAHILTTPQKAVFLCNGPDSYISPDWYNTDDQVPTWNYVAIRLEGEAYTLPDDHLAPLLDKLSAHFEQKLAPKTPWTTAKMSDGVMQRMMRSITPFSMKIKKINSTWKLNQKKSAAIRMTASDSVEKHKLGANTDALSTLMRDCDSDAI